MRLAGADQKLSTDGVERVVIFPAAGAGKVHREPCRRLPRFRRRHRLEPLGRKTEKENVVAPSEPTSFTSSTKRLCFIKVGDHAPGSPGIGTFKNAHHPTTALSMLRTQQHSIQSGMVAGADAPSNTVGIAKDRLLVVQTSPFGITVFGSVQQKTHSGRATSVSRARRRGPNRWRPACGRLTLRRLSPDAPCFDYGGE